MHRVARCVTEGGKMTKEQFEALYDPLDLYSRIQRGSGGLWRRCIGTGGTRTGRLTT